MILVSSNIVKHSKTNTNVLFSSGVIYSPMQDSYNAQNDSTVPAAFLNIGITPQSVVFEFLLRASATALAIVFRGPLVAYIGHILGRFEIQEVVVV